MPPAVRCINQPVWVASCCASCPGSTMQKFSAPLTAITAAIAGVIVNLAVFFAQQVLWPDGLGGASSGCRR